MHAFDRQTDGRTEFSSLDRVCIPCSAVKLAYNLKIAGQISMQFDVVMYLVTL